MPLTGTPVRPRTKASPIPLVKLVIQWQSSRRSLPACAPTLGACDLDALYPARVLRARTGNLVPPRHVIRRNRAKLSPNMREYASPGALARPPASLTAGLRPPA